MASKKQKNESPKNLSDRILAQDRRALSRMISLIEEEEETFDVFENLYKESSHGHCVGITGPPGAGKSTLIDSLIEHIRKVLKKKVGVIAVDPSSPFTGGAVLGDRIRMQKHYSDDGVFIRSLGSRGHRGGLSMSAKLLTKLYSAYGFDYVLIETVGVGQSEVDIMDIADTTVVMLVPESGDTIQTMKAGLLEIADIFIVNKSDRDGASAIGEELLQMSDLECTDNGWKVPVLMIQANSGKGIGELMDQLKRHKEFIPKQDGYNKKRESLKKRLVTEIALTKFKREIKNELNLNEKLNKELNKKNANPFKISKQLLEIIRKNKR